MRLTCMSAALHIRGNIDYERGKRVRRVFFLHDRKMAHSKQWIGSPMVVFTEIGKDLLEINC